MRLDEYQTLALQTAVYPRVRGIDYLTLGLAGEVGEVANCIKKVYRDHDGEITNAADMALEVGDCFWYCAALATEIGFTQHALILPKRLPDLMSCGLCLAKYAGRLAEYAELPFNSLQIELIKETLIDVTRYLSAVAYHLGIGVESILQGNLDKLAERKSRGH